MEFSICAFVVISTSRLNSLLLVGLADAFVFLASSVVLKEILLIISAE
jgi:hypothetical protein